MQNFIITEDLRIIITTGEIIKKSYTQEIAKKYVTCNYVG